ncbi:Gfo/Idh/MocA family oxidoreductase [Ruania suaedae]|uniref:Gfo/Idh/MocA family protein n=1 Tax=Ruania suaedae TaxID=2897774 RepID=UPI001E386FA4|nr:Gfo/Idh/MocA family oxidoreductase [Ruania suaedae]UFU01775.1 Gfo/Idh/MocA family oxidoreductase [Ruania suaedae]
MTTAGLPEPTAATAAIVGCGDIAALHAEALTALGIEVAGVVDTDPGRAHALASGLGTRTFPDVPSLLATAGPSVVHVCTPHAEHAGVARQVLDGGAHLLLEKPVAHTLEQAEALTETAQAAQTRGVRSGVVYQNRYNRPNRRLHELITSGALGRVHGARAAVSWYRTPEYYADRPWRGTWAGAGGGVLMNQAIHTLDLLLWLLGPAAAVTGHAATHLLGEAIEVEDTAEILITHAGGARSLLHATNAYPLNAPVTLEVHGEIGSATMSGDLLVRWHDGRTETVPAAAPSASGRSYWGDSHRLLIADFYERLEEPEPFWIGLSDGAATVAAIAAVYDASPGLRSRPGAGPG